MNINYGSLTLNDLIENEVKGIDVLFENCECMYIPIKCFKTFNYSDGDIEFSIENNGEIYYKSSWDNGKTNPIHRLEQRDMVRLYLDIDDKEEISLDINFEGDEINELQMTKIESYKEVKIVISKVGYSINQIVVKEKEIEHLKNQIKELKEIVKEEMEGEE